MTHKVAAPQPFEPLTEVKFIALPRIVDIANSDIPQGRKMSYENLGRQMHRVQAHMAEIGLQAMRPDIYNRLNGERRYQLRLINEEFAKQALAEFSETCTKGL